MHAPFSGLPSNLFSHHDDEKWHPVQLCGIRRSAVETPFSSSQGVTSHVSAKPWSFLKASCSEHVIQMFLHTQHLQYFVWASCSSYHLSVISTTKKLQPQDFLHLMVTISLTGRSTIMPPYRFSSVMLSWVRTIFAV